MTRRRVRRPRRRTLAMVPARAVPVPEIRSGTAQELWAVCFQLLALVTVRILSAVVARLA